MRIRILLTLALALPLAAADVAGTWTLNGEVAGNIIKGSCSLKQDHEKLTGTCKLETKEVADATGEATESKVVFRHKVEHDGTIYTLEYAGKLDGSTIKGDINVINAGATGYFTATKQ